MVARILCVEEAETLEELMLVSKLLIALYGSRDLAEGASATCIRKQTHPRRRRRAHVGTLRSKCLTMLRLSIAETLQLACVLQDRASHVVYVAKQTAIRRQIATLHESCMSKGTGLPVRAGYFRRSRTEPTTFADTTNNGYLNSSSVRSYCTAAICYS